MNPVIALAVTDRPIMRKLIAAGEITVDYLETTGPYIDRDLFTLPKQTFLLHNSVWDWSLAHPDCLNQQGVVPATLTMIDQLRAPWLSVHLGFSAEEVTFDQWMKPVTAPLAEDRLFANICRNLSTFAAMIPIPLLIENLDYNTGGAYESVCQPGFIAAVLEAADVGFLLDLAHARVSAARLGIHIDTYLAQLPLTRVQQIHISGPRWQDDILTDVHESLLDEDYALLEKVLRQTKPRALTLEFTRDEALLKADLSRLSTILGRAVDPV